MFQVFLVDDEYWALIGLQRLFAWTDYGFEVAGTFTDPLDALEAIRTQKPDAVFTDIRMPELTGLQLMKRVREQGLDTEFIIVSGYGEFIYAQEALQLGAFDYRLKPLQEKESLELLGGLKKLLEQKKEYRTDPDGAAVRRMCSNEHFAGLLRFVQENYATAIYLRQLAGQFFLNETYCSELFKKTTGKTFSEYLNSLRVTKARGLLEATGKSVLEISESVGFKDYYYFNKVFKKFTGLTPAQYRKQGFGGEPA